MKEVYNFSQEDLNMSDVMVLDAYSSIFMWMGQKANKAASIKEINSNEMDINKYRLET